MRRGRSTWGEGAWEPEGGSNEVRREEEGVVRAVKDGRGEVMVDILQGDRIRLAEGLIANISRYF